MNAYRGLLVGFLVLLVCVSWRQISVSCEPRIGSCKVCDSIRVLYRADALALAFRESQDSTLPYYSNVIIQETRIKTYEKVLALLYNNLEDSLLFGLRTYHQPEAKDTTEFYKVAIQVKGANSRKWRLRNGQCGYANINTILIELDLRPIGEVVKKGSFLYAEYISTKPINKIALQRRFMAQPKPIVTVTRYLSPNQYVGMLDYTNIREETKFDSTYIFLTYPFGPGMPPELPYPMATDLYHVNDCSMTYIRTTTHRHQK